VINSTVEGDDDAAIWHRGGPLTVVSSTLTAEFSLYELGTVSAEEMTIANSLIVAGVYSEFQSTCNGTVISGGGNVESPTNDCGFIDPTDLVNVTAEDLKLGPLAHNGGPTMTRALLPGSVAIDWIPEAMCLDADGEPLMTDQRGEPRPVAILGPEPMCDVGAFEVQP
jgi:hypothetical protein